MPSRRFESRVIAHSPLSDPHRHDPHRHEPRPYAPLAGTAGDAMPLCDWALLSEPLQLAVAREALARAAETIAGQAMVLAAEMEEGVLPDRGGPEALRLFAAVVRVTGREVIPPAGHA
jgi:hypothetical protein